ncbi:unnamed protein product [Cuscuta europaea]|nr:unnamed protein product [Cuscuta europaea]
MLQLEEQGIWDQFYFWMGNILALTAVALLVYMYAPANICNTRLILLFFPKSVYWQKLWRREVVNGMLWASGGAAVLVRKLKHFWATTDDDSYAFLERMKETNKEMNWKEHIPVGGDHRRRSQPEKKKG